ncbi:MAG: hypothetical protein OXC31_13920 [Spirochaetaceae bacterium]|nr:hypothetical protein [Spirochaetaceae bacterium]
MSTLTRNEQRYLEKMLEMDGGYVLSYSDATYGEFFRRHGVEIHSERFQTYGTSKAKKMRSFWNRESDALVATVLGDMFDEYEVDCDLEGRQVDASLLGKSRSILARLSGRETRVDPEGGVERFLGREFAIPNVRKLPIEDAVVPIVESRLDEAQKAMRVGAYLSVVVLCGSILEAVLLGNARQEPRRFNSATGSPRRGGKVKGFYDWTLANFIDVANEIGLLKVDVQKFSHGLRDFRNYIHPYQQISSGFTPDEHTAKVCFQVLRAALASVAGER